MHADLTESNRLIRLIQFNSFHDYVTVGLQSSLQIHSTKSKQTDSVRFNSTYDHVIVVL